MKWIMQKWISYAKLDQHAMIEKQKDLKLSDFCFRIDLYQGIPPAAFYMCWRKFLWPGNCPRPRTVPLRDFRFE
jgi:hypothetical protein